MNSKGALSAFAVMLLGFAQAAQPAADAQAQPAHEAKAQAVDAVLHHTTRSQTQQNAAEASLQRAAQSRISITQAISLVAQRTGGAVVQASFVMEGATPTYTMRAITGASVWSGRVNADNGAVIASSGASEKEELGPADRTDIGLARHARVPMARAVGLAEGTVGGRVLDAALEDVQGSPKYEMQVLSGNRISDVVVDATAGTVHLVG